MQGFSPSENEAIKSFQRVKEHLTLFNNSIMYGTRGVIPKCYRRRVLEQLHSYRPGVSAMNSIARSLLWYPEIQ